MNEPNPIEMQPQKFSIFRLPFDKLVGFILCTIQGNPKRFIPIAIIVILGIVGIVYALCKENPELTELQNLNAQASQMIYKNQPEEAIRIYDQILERISKRTDNLATEWTLRIRGAKTMATSKSEMNLLRKCQPLIAQAETLLKNGNTSEARKILKQMNDDLEKSPWKGTPTEAMIARIRTMKK